MEWGGAWKHWMFACTADGNRALGAVDKKTFLLQNPKMFGAPILDIVDAISRRT
jgi:hypothetical protein